MQCTVVTMMQCVHSLHNTRNQSKAICRQLIRIDIEVEYFCDNIIYNYLTSIYVFVVHTMHKI